MNFKKCINNLGSYHCECYLGFEGNGYFCNDIDECDPLRFVGDGCDLGKFWKIDSYKTHKEKPLGHFEINLGQL